MKKRILLGLVLTVFAFLLAACWNGEVKVETTFNRIGGGERVITLDVIDESLSETPIGKRDNSGNVENNQYFDGGVTVIQAWLETNAPDILTVHPMETEGYHRYFKLSYTFDSWSDFLSKYEILVNASPSEYTWANILPEQMPTMTVDGRKVTIKDSRDVLKASLDWAVDGIYNSIYKKEVEGAANNKNAMFDLFNITMHLNTAKYELENYLDEEASPPAMANPVSTTEFYEIEFEFNPEVTFNLNGGKIGESIDDIIVEVNKGTAIPEAEKPTDPTKEGATFKFWSASKEIPAAFDFETLINEDLTLYAIFESEEPVETVTVTFDLNGGKIGASTTNVLVEVDKGGKLAANQRPANPVKEGYSFSYWATSKTATEGFDFNKEITANTTLFAVYTKNITEPITDKPKGLSAGAKTAIIIGSIVVVGAAAGGFIFFRKRK